jgi:hypothetical protein
MEFILLILFVIITILAKLTIPPLLIRRAVRPVIERFLNAGAMNEADAKSIDDLGLGPRRLVERMVSLRDYKPKALEALISASVVLYTEEGKLYLSKEKLMATGMMERWPALAERLRTTQ